METISRAILTFLLNAAWQVTLIALLATLICRLMRNGPASHRHAVWIAALAASLLLPIASLRTADEATSLSYAVPDPSTLVVSAPAAVAPALPIPKPSAHPLSVSYAPQFGAVLLGAYLLFLLFRCAVLFWSWIRTERIRGSASAVTMPAPVERVWLRCMETFGVYDVELLRSAAVPSPVAAGAWRKSIILPESLLAETSEDVLATAIGHEMAHLARRDFALKVICEIAWLPLSFHPAALVIHRRIEQTREMACDELVTRKLLDAGAYARSIMTIARSMTALPGPGYALGVFDGDILEQRIRRLVERRAFNLPRARLLLATGLGALALCVALASGLAVSARAQTGAAGDELKLGGVAYNHGDFENAIRHFQAAVRLEPANIRPKLLLANALMRQHDTQNAQSSTLDSARQQYLDVLARDPQNRQALEGMVMSALYTKQYTESTNWVRKLIQAHPEDHSAYYVAGFVDWVTAYPAYTQARAAAGMRMDMPGIIPDAAARKNFRDQYGPQIEDGLGMLQTALQLEPSDSDAMAYTNLLYRLKSGIVDSETESRALVQQADQWVGKALDAKRLNARNPKPAHQGLDVNADLPGPGMLPAPPPPPPPPPPSSNQPASAVAMRPHNPNELPGTFWQVTKGDTYASALAASLKEQSFPVRIVAAPDGLVRVMVGPYADAPSLDQGKAALGAAGVTVVRQW